jgi:hypothetical protein
MRVFVTLMIASSMALVAACKGNPPASEQPAASAAPAAAAESHEGHTAGAKVFFVKPLNGESVKSPVQFEFGSGNFQISPVPAGEVTSARPGMGHYHLGVDTDCLPVGTVIPKADPWIHFGTGSNMIEYPMKPGMHKAVLQAGDDQHRTLEGLCETITINVTE